MAGFGCLRSAAAACLLVGALAYSPRSHFVQLPHLRHARSPAMSATEGGSSAEPSVSTAKPDADLRAELKAEFFEVIAPLGFGYDSTPEDRAEVLEILDELEELNPTPRPLETPERFEGDWELLFTTSTAVRNVKGVSGVNQWFRDAEMKSFVQTVRCEPNYVRYTETVDLPGFVSGVMGNVVVAEGFWTQQEDEPNTMVTDANKVTMGPMKYDSDQWQSLRCLMIQNITYLDEDFRVQRGLVPHVVFVFRRKQ